MMSFLKTDTITFRSPFPKLAEIQEQKFAPLNKWLSRHYRIPPLNLTTQAEFLQKVPQPEQTILTIQWKLFHSTDFELGCFHALSMELKSIVLALALSENVISVEEAIEYSRLEETHQYTKDGYVEGNHDVEESNIRVGVAAASIFYDLLDKRKDTLFEHLR